MALQAGSSQHSPLSLARAAPSPLHICIHFPRLWDVTLHSHIKSILSTYPHLISRHLQFYCRPSYKANEEALLLLIGSHMKIVEYALDAFIKSLLERGWAVRRARGSDESRDLTGYTNIYLVQQYTQRAVLGSTGRVNRFTATGSLATTPIVEDFTPVCGSTDEDWLARGNALIEEERTTARFSSSSIQHHNSGPARATSSPVRADRPAKKLQPAPHQASAGIPTRRRRFRARVSNAVGGSGPLYGILKKLGGGM